MDSDNLNAASVVLQTGKLILFAFCCIPLLLLCWRAFQSDLGANPVEEVIHVTGIWALRFLLLALLISPLARISRMPGWSRIRRMLGLFAFFYAVLHLCGYLILDQWFDWQVIVEDVLERPYITLGMVALMMMFPLAITSTVGWQRRLGVTWVKLHRLVYVVAVLAVVHFWLQVKADFSEPIWYVLILGALLIVRGYFRLKRELRFDC